MTSGAAFTNLEVKWQHLAALWNLVHRKENCPGSRVGSPVGMAVGGCHRPFCLAVVKEDRALELRENLCKRL